MARRRYLLAYDIRDQQRLPKVAKCAEGFGDRIQYSVFICDLSDMEVVMLKAAMTPLIDPTKDSIMIVYLGEPDAHHFTFLGQRIQLPAQTALII